MTRLVRSDTPLGGLLVAVSDAGVVSTLFADDQDVDPWVDVLEARLDEAVLGPGRAHAAVRREVEAYFAGRLRSFESPLDLSLGPTGFGRRVLQITAEIPFAELWTYGDVAGLAGSPRAGRAAGNALGRCPIELFVPCHRVVHAGGSIGGYGRHTARKRALIEHERRIADGTIPSPREIVEA